MFEQYFGACKTSLLEALEERRLFEKIRGADELDLIHRAYIVGGTA